MGSDIGVGVRSSPRVQVVGEMHAKRATRREVGLVDEHDGHARLVGAEPVAQEQRVVGEVIERKVLRFLDREEPPPPRQQPF